MKSVRIDNRTLIRVDKSIPDDIARKNYLKKISVHPVEKNIYKGSQRKKKEIAEKIIPFIGSEDEGEYFID